MLKTLATSLAIICCFVSCKPKISFTASSSKELEGAGVTFIVPLETSSATNGTFGIEYEGETLKATTDGFCLMINDQFFGTLTKGDIVDMSNAPTVLVNGAPRHAASTDILVAPALSGDFVYDVERTLQWAIDKKHPYVSTEEKRKECLEALKGGITQRWDNGSLEIVSPSKQVEPINTTWVKTGPSTFQTRYMGVMTILEISEDGTYHTDMEREAQTFREFFVPKEPNPND